MPFQKRPVDKTKKSNIKCEHCEGWQPTGKVDRYGFPIKGCMNPDNNDYGKPKHYWNRCKLFQWKQDLYKAKT